MRIEEFVYDDYYQRIPVLDGFSKKEALVCKKVVDKDGNIIAGCGAYIYGWGGCYVDDMWVDEKYRNQGLGTRLVRHFEKKAKETGATKILSLEIYDWNVGFFLKNGYKIAGELKDLPKGHCSFVLEKDL